MPNLQPTRHVVDLRQGASVRSAGSLPAVARATHQSVDGAMRRAPIARRRSAALGHVRPFAQARTAVASVLTSPTRLISLLSIACGVLVAVYLTLVITTVLFATWQTQLASSIRDEQGSIGTLEMQYYSRIGQLNSTDPATLGFVTPHQVAYVSQTPHPGLSLLIR